MKKIPLVVVSIVFLAQTQQSYSGGKTDSHQITDVLQKLTAIQMDLARLDGKVAQTKNAVDEKIGIYENDPGGSRYTFLLPSHGSYQSSDCNWQYATLKEIKENKRYVTRHRGQEVDRKLETLHRLKEQIEENVLRMYFLKGKVMAVQQLLGFTNITQTSNGVVILEKCSSELTQIEENVERLLDSVYGVHG